MPKPFRLVDKHFSPKDNEWQRTYGLRLTFNKSEIIAITITDHYQQKSDREWITNELVLEILEKLNGWGLESTKYRGKRKVYKWEITYHNQRYRLWFWFKDGTNNHLWIRNIHPID
ncbi:hypothetical protein [endosymbiont GvMRE of Glomus versiforme]|uniref:hypothetical protein n=1 Tax=endosymbiont GvMRE of Glomus versiforme TaxID=2039283 RepID=UPI000EEAE088|nr:hypothetical protein [endosymbiont GvMRE of Glomus versiforme]RHZ36488.1 hypothetical protein GvMRE_I2g513 [endosymbiont GvMRE of Glomus versiforme]